MKILSTQEMQACDRVTTERYGVPSLELMRAAGRAVAEFGRAQFPRARRVTVLCGRGNNGGDGAIAARLLAEAGLEVTVLLLGGAEGLAGDAAAAWSEQTEAGPATVHAVASAEELAGHDAALRADLIVDAIVGTGFKPPLRGLAQAALEWVKGSRAPILAVDLPSGWDADETGSSAAGPTFPSDAVITFTAPKPAHVFGHLTRAWDQPVVVAPIGSPPEAIVSASRMEWAGSAMEMARAPRGAGANKGNFGHVLVLGGTFGPDGGKVGAPGMSALAAMRAGAGLVTAAVPAPGLPVLAALQPELMTWPLEPSAEGHISARNATPELFAKLLAGKTVLALGPGMGQSADTLRFAHRLLETSKIPVVIDADVLNLLAVNRGHLMELGKSAREGRTVVMTPHPGEMARLAQTTVAEVQANRLEVARGFAQRFSVTLVLKGARTLIAHPDGRVAVNTTGNPGMAKGGSGDLLTGVVAGLLAQHPHEAGSAVEAAVYLHGLAADFAVRSPGGLHDEHTLLATDSLRYFSQAFRFDSRGGNGYVWLQGAAQAASPREATE